jgi:transposase
MKTVELYRKVRKACHRDGMSGRDAAKYFGVNRRTISKILEHSEPPGYRRSKPIKRPKLDGFTGTIDAILKADTVQPKKQRHTAKRIFERLCKEHGFRGGITIVRDYVREHKRLHKEVYVPLEHAPGHAQADFGEALAIIGGVQQKVHYMAFDLPHSDGSFVKAYPAETTEAFCDGHVSAFAFFGGVPLSILYDNTRIAVSKIRKGGKRDLTAEFTRLQSHYLFEAKFGRPAKGNDKGHVEGMVGYIRRNYLVPIPRFDSFDALNKHLEEQCLKMGYSAGVSLLTWCCASG